jgi:hypothetical protein
MEAHIRFCTHGTSLPCPCRPLKSFPKFETNRRHGGISPCLGRRDAAAKDAVRFKIEPQLNFIRLKLGRLKFEANARDRAMDAPQGRQ